MNKLKLLTALLLIAGLSGLGMGISSMSQTESAAFLDREIQQPIVLEGHLSKFFGNVLAAAHLPGGIVFVSDCTEVPNGAKYSFPASTTTVRDALNSITTLDKSYRWEAQKNAINLLPVSGEPDLLKMTINDFKLDEPHATVIYATGKLLQHTDIQRAESELAIQKNDLEQYVGGVSPGIEMKLHLHNLTLRQALNAIAAAHGHAVWQYSESRCSKHRTFTITWIVR
jgi:hypothetical protein